MNTRKLKQLGNLIREKLISRLQAEEKVEKMPETKISEAERILIYIQEMRMKEQALCLEKIKVQEKIRDQWSPAEKAYQSALTRWNHIKDSPNKTLENVYYHHTLSLVLADLKQAVDENHYEATRCYAGLLLDNLLRSQAENSSIFCPARMKESALALETILKLIDQPAYKQDAFAQSLIITCLWFRLPNDASHFFNKLEQIIEDDKTSDAGFLLAFLITQARNHKFDPSITEAVIEKRYNEGLDKNPLFLYPLLFGNVLEILKTYDLNRAKSLLDNVKFPFAPTKCEFYTIPPMPDSLYQAAVEKLRHLIAFFQTPSDSVIQMLLKRAAPKQNDQTEEEKNTDVNIQENSTSQDVTSVTKACEEVHIPLSFTSFKLTT